MKKKSHNSLFVSNNLLGLGSLGTGTSTIIDELLLIYVAVFQCAFSFANNRLRALDHTWLGQNLREQQLSKTS